ncbi:MAG: hypothetical protein IPO81_08655 [Kouleothrix sp.]|nr:hypothetical protein [Kouleothrix sp.]
MVCAAGGSAGALVRLASAQTTAITSRPAKVPPAAIMISRRLSPERPAGLPAATPMLAS